MQGRPITGESRQSGRSRASSFSHCSRASEVDALRVPPRNRRIQDSSSIPNVGRFAVTGLPGYTGYIPGKSSENVYGATFQSANHMATTEMDMRRSGFKQPVLGRTHGPAPGADIPGYMGFVPGKNADNVIGTTHARGSETAWLIKSHQMNERHQRVNSYRQGQRPPTGTHDYSGYRSQGNPFGPDARTID